MDVLLQTAKRDLRVRVLGANYGLNSNLSEQELTVICTSNDM